MSATSPQDEFTLAAAGEMRNPANGRRQWRCERQLRRDVKSGILPHRVDDGRYIVTRAALDLCYPENVGDPVADLGTFIEAFVSNLAPLDTEKGQALISRVEAVVVKAVASA
ncbi:MAG: hypothetical protein SO046_02260 [Actinomyces urogenitalis]|uniref:hypothetical protein n=1 Tax=Actinomyces urogenitalis TaxID=103621 RepID=UPI002A821ACC|nr:hypothetical protein [Actinomyces urogenitalis]MDY3678029.1 hypothetical protein [Actinomyces urogenitalis]